MVKVTIPKIQNTHDSEARNIINETIDVVNKVPNLDKLSDDAVGKINTYVNNIESVGSLLANKGVAYPLKNEKKDGVIHSFDEEVKNVILDAKVFNPTPGKVYSIREVLNGAVAGGVPGYGISIDEYDEDTFYTNSEQSRKRIISSRLEGSIPKPTENIQTIEVTVENTRFVVTVDFSAMSLNALYVTGVASPKAEGNIIHPNNYVYSMPNQLELPERNKGIVYPLHNVKRDNKMHPVSSDIKNVVLDAKVIGAEEGKVYAISYISNGAFDSYGFYIDEFDESKFSTDSSISKRRLVDIGEQPFDDPNGGVVTRVAQGNNGTKFVITLDYSEISGTSLNNQNTGNIHGYGLIIDKSNYIYRIQGNSENEVRKPLKVLMVGNSYARNVTAYIHNIAASANVDCIFGVLYRAGESLQGHWEQASGDLSSYTYYKRVSDSGYASNTTTNNVSISTAFADEDWDIVTYQQAPSPARDYSSYQPYLNNLINYVEGLAGEKELEHAIHMTWSHARSLDNSGTMYTDIVDAYAQSMNAEKIGSLIPMATVVENARTNEYLNAVDDELTSDGYHLGNFGEYLGGLGLFESLLAGRFKKDIFSDVTFVPTSGDKHLAYLGKLSVKNAVMIPFRETEI